MNFPRPVVDLRQFRFSRLNTDQFRHLKLLLFWPAFGLAFHFCENVFTPDRWHVMHCALDDVIPFCELFVIPYIFWFVFLIGMHTYTALYDVNAFRRMMRFIILTYSAALVLFIAFPTAQYLRPAVFQRDNVLTRLMALFYTLDTNTNVCPSLHVVGSMAVLFAAWDTPRFRSMGWRLAFGTVTALICLSTVFLKQHSAIDVAVGLLFSAGAYRMVYRGGLARLAAFFSGQRPEKDYAR